MQLPPSPSRPKPSAGCTRTPGSPSSEETRKERLAEVERIARTWSCRSPNCSSGRTRRSAGPTEDKEIRACPGAEGRLAQAENRHAELLARRERRGQELERQRSLTLQAVERLASVLSCRIPSGRRPRSAAAPNLETEATAMQVVMEHERRRAARSTTCHEKNLGYDVTSLDLNSGELRLIEVKGSAPDHRHDSADAQRAPRRRGPPRLLLGSTSSPLRHQPVLQEPIRDPARFDPGTR
jgi:hypothetical protein